MRAAGHGAETLRLAARGWTVTALDFSPTALAHVRATAEAAGTDVAGRIDYAEGDLATWTPQPGHFDLVTCLYVHCAGSVEEMVRRMASGVAPGGTLFLVGHRPIGRRRRRVGSWSGAGAGQHRRGPRPRPSRFTDRPPLQ